MIAVQERVHAHVLCVHDDLQLVSQTCRLHLSNLKLFHGQQIARVSKPQPSLLTSAMFCSPFPRQQACIIIFWHLLKGVYCFVSLPCALCPPHSMSQEQEQEQ
jgi:hypothetical protein